MLPSFFVTVFSSATCCGISWFGWNLSLGSWNTCPQDNWCCRPLAPCSLCADVGQMCGLPCLGTQSTSSSAGLDILLDVPALAEPALLHDARLTCSTWRWLTSLAKQVWMGWWEPLAPEPAAMQMSGIFVLVLVLMRNSLVATLS